MISSAWRPFTRGFVGAIIGVVIVLLAIHLYQDHLALHQLIIFANAAAPKIQKLP